jgi:hypothetical protein
MTTTKLLRSRMNRNDSRPVLKTSGAGDSLAEFNYLIGQGYAAKGGQIVDATLQRISSK